MPTGAAELAYTAEGIAQDERADGRACADFRPMEFELGIIAQAHGSARLHLGATDVIVAVKVRAARGKLVGGGGSRRRLVCRTRQSVWQTRPRAKAL
jgi:ribonuclease PH